VKDRRTAIVIISVSAIAMALALKVTIDNPSQDLTFAFGEPNEFQRQLDSCLKKADNVVNCLPSTISPSSSEPEDTSQTPVTPVNAADQLSLLQNCLSNEEGCSPSVDSVRRDIFQVPFKTLQVKEVVLEVRPDQPDLVNVDVVEMAEELAANYNVVVIDTVDVPGYKAIVIQAPDVNNPIFRDSRFVNYNLADNNSGVGELNAVSGHNTQLKWNQTIPYGIKRIIPISNETVEVSNSSNSASTIVNNTAPASVATSETLRPTNQTGGNTTSNVDLAILDTGISLNHPDLNVYRNISFVDGIPSGNDPIGHGSHVAGIAAAKDNSIGVVGVVPGARLWAIKVCDNSGECKISDQIKGIEYAIKHADEIDVLNISIENPNSPALNSIISAAVKAGITVVVSAGNYGRDASTTTPANNPDVLTVSAIGDSDGKCGAEGPPLKGRRGEITDDSFAYFSNFGPVVKMAAPGVDVFSTYNGSGYAVDSGTSMAAPYVAGAAALYKAEFPDASPDEVIANVTGSGSLPSTVCDGGAHGYFTGDLDRINEPLLFREIIPK
jgi:subtilisin family serine protease